jgi:U4/U6.U5 tri-snRNP component SNU23
VAVGGQLAGEQHFQPATPHSVHSHFPLTPQCELCNRTLKDSLSYLDHLNSRFHLSKLGQSTHVARSTVAQVRQRIAELREQSKTKVDAKNFDFQRRLAEIRGAEDAKRQARKDERRRKRLEERENHKLGKAGVLDKSDQRVVEAAQQEMSGIESMMGFGGFGGGRRK